MKKNKDEELKNPQNETSIEKHALDRLNNVEEKQRIAYDKKPERMHWQEIVMVVVLVIILGIMLISLKQ